eukprot:350908-Amphidinium_carterae.1
MVSSAVASVTSLQKTRPICLLSTVSTFFAATSSESCFAFASASSKASTRKRCGREGEKMLDTTEE